ncbi:MAG: NADP-dependent oxidoreductase [Cruoricaptor ignavus]|nr:NADP-dependent oxidoreductase [Cruoricaptor ignavus]
MKAVIVEKFGDVKHLVQVALPIPEISENEVLVQVKALSINPVDVKTRKGEALATLLKDENPIILGWDISGIIVKKGRNVTDFSVGDAVFGMVNFVGHGKAYAEYVAVSDNHLALKPLTVSHVEAAASTLAALTAWQAFRHFGKLYANDTVLIHAASGGVGHFAVQIANHLGAYVIGTSSAKNRDFVLSLGADEHIDYQSEPFEKKLNNIDFVLETIGYENFAKSVRVLKEGGTIVNLPSGLTEKDEQLARTKNLKACFFMSVFSNGNDMHIIANLLKNKILKPHIHKIFPFTEIGKAHLEVETNRVVGKVVVEV